jgi:hypothetical protein
MKQKTLLFLLALGVVAAAYGFSKIQSVDSELIACCDPATDPECDQDPDGPGGDGADSMPTQILG